MTNNSKLKHRGFTLVETVIAMGIITIMITAFLAAFGPAVQGIRKSISAKEANRLASSLETELSVLRSGQKASGGGNFSSSFEKAYDWIKHSGGTDKKDIVLIYQYRGDPSHERSDGTLGAYTGSGGIPGEDYVLQSVVRRLNDSAVKEELVPKVVEGRVLFVRMKQLIFKNGILELTSDPGKILDPEEPHNTSNDPEDYPAASIAFQAEFYVLKSSVYAYVDNAFTLDDDNADGHPDATGKPVFTRNFAVRR